MEELSTCDKDSSKTESIVMAPKDDIGKDVVFDMEQHRLFFKTRALATILRVPERTVASWAKRGKAPLSSATRKNDHVPSEQFYAENDVLSFLSLLQYKRSLNGLSISNAKSP